MFKFSIASIKFLRKITNASIMDCKDALLETDGNIEYAIKFLQKRHSSIQNREFLSREGLIGVNIFKNTGSIIEINTETDFVARSEQFVDFVTHVNNMSVFCENSIESLKFKLYPKNTISVQENLLRLSSIFRENIILRRFSLLNTEYGIISKYIHNPLKNEKNLGQIGVLLILESKNKKNENLETAGKFLAMHIAASWKELNSIRNDGLENHKHNRALSILNDQIYLLDKSNRKISRVLEDLSEEIGHLVIIKDFVCFKLGEDI